MWAEIPNLVASSVNPSDLECYYARLTKTMIDGAADGSLRFDNLIVRVEDPWINDWGSTNENGWLFDPDPSRWNPIGGDGKNPFFEMLVNVKKALKDKVKIHFLPQLHQGSYFRWPCYPVGGLDPLANRTTNCSDVPGFITTGDTGDMQCGAAVPSPANCSSSAQRPDGCACSKSWDCESNWCNSKGKCDKPGSSWNKSKQCAIPNAVWGDTTPWAHCCTAVVVKDDTYGTHRLDYTGQACCDKAESLTGVCDAGEVMAKGGSMPCINPLARVAFLTAQWHRLLEQAQPHGGLAGVTFDMESTGLTDATLLNGMRHYLGQYAGFNRSLELGCTVGNTMPQPNSFYAGFDKWYVEAYNLFSALLSPQEDSCQQFLVDSLPKDQNGHCGRSCENLACDTVTPPCSTSVYDLHRDDPKGLVGAHSSLDTTMRELLVPAHGKYRCTSSWRPNLEKVYQVSYSATVAAGKATSDAAAAGREAVKALFRKTVVLFSTETRMDVGVPPSCLYPNQGDCGVPRAFGSWNATSFTQFLTEFRELSMDVTMDDGTKDKIDFGWLPEAYSGIFQFSFLPKKWLPSDDPAVCSVPGPASQR